VKPATPRPCHGTDHWDESGELQFHSGKLFSVLPSIVDLARTAGIPDPRGAVPGGRGGDTPVLDTGTELPTANNTHEVAQVPLASVMGPAVCHDLGTTESGQ
jgi:hypothetical protein